ncbi:glutathione S-transferase C-terminal domain-containing protein [Fodinicola acaciae]|uniref:glutathione S-transferase C-terminal domain-containing protein n=1 Tax=Fodinicola acaciae TaxID=2681555 RepID=UPI0013D5A20C|nr:glutathione S-transferase C-terminal domain-containing protein [Fodinicola acaciae]
MPRFASPADVAAYGEYRVVRDDRPLYRFAGRLGSGDFPAEAGRYHLYAGWFCPWAQRCVIEIGLHGLEDVISVSYVDNDRDARGWAFRETYGPDPVNGFALLREAYEATEPGFDGHVSVPTLWDRQTGRIVSNDFAGIGVDIATRFAEFSNGANTYPAALRDQIEELDGWLGAAVNRGAGAAAADPAARAALLDAFAELDARLAKSRYLLGSRLTEADVRLWVTLVRYDAGPNAERTINPGLPEYPHLWAYARELYQIPAFGRSTDFASFSRPGATVPDWDVVVERSYAA